MRLGLLTRIALALATVGLVPLLLTSLRLVGINRESMSEQVLRTNVVATNTVAANISDQVESRRSLARAAANNPAVYNNPLAPEATGFLSSFLAARPDLGSLALYDSAGTEIVRAQRKEDAELMGRILADPATDSPLLIVQEGLWLRLEVAMPEDRGTLRLVADAAPITEAVNDSLIGDQASLSLIDAQGGVLAGTPLRRNDLPQEILEGTARGYIQGIHRETDEAGREILAAFNPVPSTPWMVLSRQPAAAAEAVSQTMLRDSLTSLGFALLLTGLLSSAAYVSIVRPIRDLTRVQRRLAGLSTQPSRGNEIEDLRASFERLEQRIKDRDALERIFLGRYQILGILGQGAMGMVFRAWDPKLQRPLAIKTVHLGPEQGESRNDHLARLLQEAVTVARFQHPNIVAVYDMEDTEDMAYIVMELVDGVSLERYLAEHKVLAPGPAALLGQAMAAGLAEAHRADIVHHDVKPANILLGADRSIKVADFGIAQAISTLNEASDLVFGTPGYLPPEALQGMGYTPAGDLFSLGVVLYEAVTGLKPFGAGTLKQIISGTLHTVATPAHQLDPGIPQVFGELLDRLMSKSPEARPSDAEKVASSFAAIAETLGARWDVEIESQLETEQLRDDESPKSLLVHTLPAGDAVRG
ncbi:MAG: serine/threonine protein kinase [Acidobacteriota bacterium]